MFQIEIFKNGSELALQFISQYYSYHHWEWRHGGGGGVALISNMRNSHTSLIGKLEGNKPLGGPRHRWEVNIELDLEQSMSMNTVINRQGYLELSIRRTFLSFPRGTNFPTICWRVRWLHCAAGYMWVTRPLVGSAWEAGPCCLGAKSWCKVAGTRRPKNTEPHKAMGLSIDQIACWSRLCALHNVQK
jgi:hypothetical protein